MTRWLLSFVSVSAAALVIAGCSQAAPSLAPTQAPAAPTKTTEPIKAAASPASTQAASAPTTVPAKKVDYPQGGKSVTIIVPYAAGGGSDVGARMLAAYLQKQLGGSFVVVDKPGASSEIGATDLATAKPDGTTLAWLGIPTVLTTYLDPARKAIYNRKSFEPIAGLVMDPNAIAVDAKGPYKTTKDLVDAAKAKQGAIRMASAGFGGVTHLGGLMFERAAGVSFAWVHFDGGAPAVTALLGGHVDAISALGSNYLAQFRSGDIRVLGVMDSMESPFFTGVKTMDSQGYKADFVSSFVLAGPAGMPKDVVDVLTTTIKKGLADPELTKQLAQTGFTPRYMDPQQLASYWAEQDGIVAPLMSLVKK